MTHSCPSSPTSPSPPLPPWATIHDPLHQWVSLRRFASIYRRSHSWAHKLYESGAIYDFGFTVYKSAGLSGEVWIRVPKTLLTDPT